MSDWGVGRWHLARLGKKYLGVPDVYFRVFKKIYDVCYRRTPTYGEAVATEKTAHFFARAWAIERARRKQLEKKLAEALGE